MADDAKSVKVSLHPMHQQVLANLAILRAATAPDKRTLKAIEVLQKIDEELKTIHCPVMSLFVKFEQYKK